MDYCNTAIQKLPRNVSHITVETTRSCRKYNSCCRASKEYTSRPYVRSDRDIPLLSMFYYCYYYHHREAAAPSQPFAENCTGTGTVTSSNAVAHFRAVRRRYNLELPRSVHRRAVAVLRRSLSIFFRSPAGDDPDVIRAPAGAVMSRHS